MKALKSLPGDFRKIRTIDLVNNKRELLLVNLGALALIAAMAVLGTVFHMFDSLGQRLLEDWWLLLVLGGMMLAYIPLHELVHGAVMQLISGVKPRYGFSLTYAYAGSEVYFGRRSYVLVALAPVVLWGIVLLALSAALPEWRGAFYLVQICNISGAMGDFYCAWQVSRLPRTILIQDTGTQMQIFAPADE